MLLLPGKQRHADHDLDLLSRRVDARLDDQERADLEQRHDDRLPVVEETAAVLSFTQYNATAADLVVVAKKAGEHRTIRVFNGARS